MPQRVSATLCEASAARHRQVRHPPVRHREGSEQAALDGAACAELLAEAFARWSEVRLADKPRLYDALSRRGERLPFRIPFDSALAIALRLGAGKLVMHQGIG